MYNEDQDLQEIANQYGVGVVYDGNDNPAQRVNTRKRVWDVQDRWGNGDKLDPTLEGEYMRFHPGRDIKWHLKTVVPQMQMLEESGIITIDSLYTDGHFKPAGLFKGDEGLNDFTNFMDVCDGLRAREILDIAPDAFIAQELIKQTGETVEEKRVKLTARDFLPFTNYNTWQVRYRFDRIEERGHGFSQPMDIGSMAGIPTPTQRVTRKPVYRPLYHHYSGAVWNTMALEALAEARANGAPDLQEVQRFTRMAQDDIRRTENCMAYFGNEGEGIIGLVDNDEITRTDAGGQVGSVDTVADRALFVDTVCAIFEESIDNESVDLILVGTRMWCYLNKTLYFDGVTSGSTETLLSVIMKAVGPMGVKRIEWAPEMEFRQLQATRLQSEHGFSQALAERWAGGFNQENVIVFMDSSRPAGSVAMGKALGARPQETFRDEVEVRYVASSGGFDVRQPAAFRIRTNVGPV